MHITVRPARLEDAEDVVRVHEQASAELFSDVVGKPLEEFMPFAARVEEYRRGLGKVSPDAQVIVAESAGRVIGMAVWRREATEGELRDLYVIPEAWGTGVAKELMDAALEGLRLAGAEEAFLWVVEANPRARRFYEREGWSYDGTQRATPLGPAELRYRLTLGSNRMST
jgi:GNAT superfamily N-acetyltransferase